MRNLLAIVACLLLLIGAWLAISSRGQSGVPTSLHQEAHSRVVPAPRQKTPRQTLPVEPPLGMSLTDSYQPLSERAQAGDAKAAIRLFNDLSECLHVSRLDAAFRAEVKDKNSFLNNPGGSPLSTKQKTKDLDVIKKELDEIRRTEVLCGNLPGDFNDGRIYQVALQAARAGDADATACLLMAPYDTRRPTPDEGREYATEVMRLAEDGLGEGNWNVASAMRFIYATWSVDGTGSHAGYQGFLKTPDPVKELQYSELIRLGTPDNSPEAVSLDRGLSMMRSRLSPAQQAVAERWAEKTYASYFLHSGFPVQLLNRGGLFLLSDSKPCCEIHHPDRKHGLFLRPRQLPHVRPVIPQLIDRIVDIRQGGMRGVLAEALVHGRRPAACQLLQGRHVQIAIMEIAFQRRHLPVQEASVLANGVAAHR